MFKHAQLESVKTWINHPDYRPLPLHGRIHRAIRQMILDGTIEAGKPLPASRALAQSLEVSRDTIETAYGQLHAEGFIVRKVGSGTHVSERARGLNVKGPKPAEIPPSSTMHLSHRGKAIFQSGGLRDFLTPRPFAPGVPETRRFPLALWERLQRQALKEYGTQVLSHSPPQGLLSLRQAIADYINLERGAHASADRVLILTSSQQALTLVASVLLDPRDAVFMEDPVYQGAYKAFIAAGLRCLPIPLDQQGMQVEHILNMPNAAKAVFLTPSHQFPSGTSLSLERRLSIIEWAHRHQGWIIEDDYDSEFHYDGKPTACVQGLDSQDRTIYIGTFTKSLFPALRLAYMVLPPPLVEAFTIARSLQDGHSAAIAQLTLARFIEGGHFGAYIRQMRQLYAQRRDTLARLLQQELSDYLRVQVPAGGMQMACHLLTTDAESEIISRARRADIELLGLQGLCQQAPYQRGFLMGFAAYSPDEIRIAVTRLKQIFTTLAP